MDDFNFDEWAELYKNHPDEFELRRKQLLDNAIASAPVQYRNKLRILQIECDVVREIYEPLDAVEIMVGMMNTKLIELNTQLKRLDTFLK